MTYWCMANTKGIEEAVRKKVIIFLWSSISIAHIAPAKVSYPCFICLKSASPLHITGGAASGVSRPVH